MFDLDYLHKIAADPHRNGEGFYSCDCGEDLEEAAREIERLREIIEVQRAGGKVMASATEVDRWPECFDCLHFRKPGPAFAGWCLLHKRPTGDVDVCEKGFERDEDHEREEDSLPKGEPHS